MAYFNRTNKNTNITSSINTNDKVVINSSKITKFSINNNSINNNNTDSDNVSLDDLFKNYNKENNKADEYISNSSQKIEVYQDIANITDENEISDVCDELIDRYGEMPDEMFNLLEIARIKCYARKLNIIKMIQKDDRVVFTFSDNKFVTPDKVSLILDTFRRQIMLSGEITPVITFKLQSNTESGTLKDVLKFLKVLAS